MATTELAAVFQKFYPCKQYEFLAYLETAKRDEIKRSSIEKRIRILSENISLNDKYG
ncbi:YdeI/OmpD-associated family protein [Flavobacterium bomense]|uniref:YdeI/OmpD-associated family protein n=1 Tax=Flavobacterium bomense TaxID=2497483 RepID=UPI001F1F87AE|nr:YdeI/OmpD-associated family protein [Flavobacterium bomense]